VCFGSDKCPAVVTAWTIFERSETVLAPLARLRLLTATGSGQNLPVSTLRTSVVTSSHLRMLRIGLDTIFLRQGVSKTGG
jgi:hypothetical protein